MEQMPLDYLFCLIVLQRCAMVRTRNDIIIQFIQKLWTLHNEIKIKIINEDRQIINEDLEKFTNRLVAKFTNNLEKFNYNVIIANMMKLIIF